LEGGEGSSGDGDGGGDGGGVVVAFRRTRTATASRTKKGEVCAGGSCLKFCGEEGTWLCRVCVVCLCF